jgi:hypothetical protein
MGLNNRGGCGPPAPPPAMVPLVVQQMMVNLQLCEWENNYISLFVETDFQILELICECRCMCCLGLEVIIFLFAALNKFDFFITSSLSQQIFSLFQRPISINQSYF